MASYDYGDRVKVYTSTPFTTAAGVVVDPATVTIAIKTPAGVWTDYVYGVDAAVVRVTTGDYYILQNVNAPGIWHYSISGLDGAGDFMGASDGDFRVRALST